MHYFVWVLVPKPESEPEKLREQVMGILAPFDEATNLIEEHPCECRWSTARAYDAPATEGCEDCKGSGVAPYKTNPIGHWDWARVGGRWDGVIRELGPLPMAEDLDFHYGSGVERMDRNTASAKELIFRITYGGGRDACPHAMCGPEGVWIDYDGPINDETGRFEHPSDEEWVKMTLDFLAAGSESGGVVVGCDIHS